MNSPYFWGSMRGRSTSPIRNASSLLRLCARMIHKSNPEQLLVFKGSKQEQSLSQIWHTSLSLRLHLGTIHEPNTCHEGTVHDSNPEKPVKHLLGGGGGEERVKQWEALNWSCDLWANERPRQKLRWEGKYPKIHTWTLQLLDQISRESQVGEK